MTVQYLFLIKSVQHSYIIGLASNSNKKYHHNLANSTLPEVCKKQVEVAGKEIEKNLAKIRFAGGKKKLRGSGVCLKVVHGDKRGW